MKKQVDFNRDIALILPVMVGVYEKANIYEPYRCLEEAGEILNSELNEAFDELQDINDIILKENCEISILEKKDLNTIKAHAFSCIFELLQVIAVSNKYLQLLERKEADKNGDS